MEETVSHRGLITVCVMLATIMQALDTTIANVALPYMMGSLSATLDQINWVLTSYIVAAAIAIPLTGFMVTRFGRKPVFIVAVTGFTIASVLCGLAASLEQMVLFRLLQGLFGAPLVPLSQSVLLDSYPREKHGSAMAIWGVGVMVGPILGPTLGGWLTENYDWRWVFFINVPIGILTIAGLMRYLTDTPRNVRASFDWTGFILLALAIGAFQMMLDRGENLDWFSSTEVLIEAGLAALALYMFVVHMMTSDNPFIDPKIFADRNLSVGLVAIFVGGLILLATMALLTPFLQQIMDYPVLTAGLVMAPRGIGMMIAMMIAGRVMSRIDPRLIFAFGLAVMAFTLWEMTYYTTDVSQATIIRTGVIQGLGMGFFFVPLSTITFATLDPLYRTQATSLFSLMRNIGSSIGISVVIFLLTRNTAIMHSDLAAHVTPFNLGLHMPGLNQVWDMTTITGKAALNGEVTKQATVIAYANDYLLMMYLVLAAIPLALLLSKPGKAPGGAPVAAVAD